MFDRGLSTSKGRQPSRTVAFSWDAGPGRALRLTESSQLNEIERGQRRVNLLPLEEGLFGEGEENNLYEEQRRQRATAEKK